MLVYTNILCIWKQENSMNDGPTRRQKISPWSKWRSRSQDGNASEDMTKDNIFKQQLEINIIYHDIKGGTQESHLNSQDLLSMTKLAQSWMLQNSDARMGFSSPSRNVVIDYFSPSFFNNIFKTSLTMQQQSWLWSSHHFLVMSYDSKTRCQQGQVYWGWVRPRDITIGTFLKSQSQKG